MRSLEAAVARARPTPSRKVGAPERSTDRTAVGRLKTAPLSRASAAGPPRGEWPYLAVAGRRKTGFAGVDSDSLNR